MASPVPVWIALLLLAALGLWLLLGRAPRRLRLYRLALTHLRKRAWQPALDDVRRLQSLGLSSRSWKDRLQRLEGQCESLAGDVALEEHRYEDGFQHYRAAAPLLGVTVPELRGRVLDAMLAEVRRLFANLADPGPLHDLLERVFKLRPGCAEALFWQGLLAVREGRTPDAIAALRESATPNEWVSIADTYDENGKPQPLPTQPAKALDPLLYFGALLLREGHVQEALKQLSAANRLYADCPFVHWQLGTALVASGSDQLAIRALHKALGRKGLPAWIKTPQQAWIESFPKPDTGCVSYVRRLAEKHIFRCPVFGHDVAAMVRQAQMALAQAYTRLGKHAETVQLFEGMLRESPPTPPMLRGLGLALARLERFDEAFKHLRAAYDQEQPKNYLTAGYLALCAARGTPQRPEDRASNLQWAIQLVSRVKIVRDREWARICNCVLSESRAAGLAVPVEQLSQLCDVLASVEDTSAAAALAFEQLAATELAAARPEHAWLYCRAAQVHGAGTSRGLPLFARTLRDEAPARAFFGERQWNFEDVEYTYLRRLAASNGEVSHAKQLGRPQESLLLRRSLSYEREGHIDEARLSAEALLQLSPGNRRALDRLAYLAYRRKDFDEAVRYLTAWEQVEPTAIVPLLRRGVIEYQRGRHETGLAPLRTAMERTQGQRRADIAFLCARLSLGKGPAGRELASAFLQECLRADAAHARAQACLAALHALSGSREQLAELAPALHQPKVQDPLFQYLAALCQLAAGHAEAALAAAHEGQIQAKEKQLQPLVTECSFVIGCALYHLRRHEQAAVELSLVADAAARSPSANHARAMLGKMAFAAGDYGKASFWWQEMDPPARAAWGLEQALPRTLLLAALAALEAGRVDEAARLLREARDSGYRHAQLGPLLAAARVRAAQRLLFVRAATPTDAATALELLRQAQQAGRNDAAVSYLLALAHKRLGQVAEARQVLRQCDRPAAHLLLQAGILALRGGGGGLTSPVQQAVQEWERAWNETAGGNVLREIRFAVGFNLVRAYLSTGQVDSAEHLFPQVLACADDTHRPLLDLLQDLLGPGGDQLRLAGRSRDEEETILAFVKGLGYLPTAEPLLQRLVAARPQSRGVAEARLEVTVLQARHFLQRCDGLSGMKLLTPCAKRKDVPGKLHAGLLNILGCCCCLAQDFRHGAKAFGAAVRLTEDDARLQQNLALACEWHADLKGRESHYSELAQVSWDRFLDLLGDRLPAPPGHAEYWEQVKFAALQRLAQRHTDAGRHAAALHYLEQAEALRANDAGMVEQLFHALNHLQRFDEAKETLVRLHALRDEAVPVIEEIVVDE